MSIFPESTGGQFLFPPNIGEYLSVTVVGEIERVQNPGGNKKANYMGKGEVNLGYYDVVPVIDLDGVEQTMKINTWKLYFALKDLGDTLDIGDEIKIDHPDRGNYVVTKVGNEK